MYSLLGVGIAERIGHEELYRGRRLWVVEERSQLGKDTQLRHGKGAELHLEPDEAGQRGLHHAGYCAPGP